MYIISKQMMILRWPSSKTSRNKNGALQPPTTDSKHITHGCLDIVLVFTAFMQNWLNPCILRESVSDLIELAAVTNPTTVILKAQVLFLLLAVEYLSFSIISSLSHSNNKPLCDIAKAFFLFLSCCSHSCSNRMSSPPLLWIMPFIIEITFNVNSRGYSWHNYLICIFIPLQEIC